MRLSPTHKRVLAELEAGTPWEAIAFGSMQWERRMKILEDLQSVGYVSLFDRTITNDGKQQLSKLQRNGK